MRSEKRSAKDSNSLLRDWARRCCLRSPSWIRCLRCCCHCFTWILAIALL